MGVAWTRPWVEQGPGRGMRSEGTMPVVENPGSRRHCRDPDLPKRSRMCGRPHTRVLRCVKVC